MEVMGAGAVATLAALLRETEERHGHDEKTRDEHHGWDWYVSSSHATRGNIALSWPGGR